MYLNVKNTYKIAVTLYREELVIKLLHVYITVN